MHKRPTLADVALAAGVSKAAASMALNGTRLDKIPKATRERVLAEATRLQYRPHGVARALVRRRADVLGVVCTLNPFLEMAHHAFEQELLAALFHHALERGYNPMIYGLPSTEEEEAAISRYADGRSDAFILLYPAPESALLHCLPKRGIPVVALCYSHSEGRWVDCDNAQGIRLAVTHLLELGHRRIAYLIDPQTDREHLRVQTFRAVLSEQGLPVREDWILPYTGPTVSTGDQIRLLFDRPDPPTALLTFNDFAAEEVCKALRQQGLRIPEDVSVVGFDDTASARGIVPALTTVRQDVVHMGRAAVDLAIAALSADANVSAKDFVLCPVELIVRESTAPPRRDS